MPDPLLHAQSRGHAGKRAATLNYFVREQNKTKPRQNSGEAVHIRSDRSNTWLISLWMGAAALAALLLAVPCLAEDGADAGPPVRYVIDFESGRPDGLRDTRYELTRQKMRVVSNPVRAGKFALELTLDREAHGDLQNHRTDLWVAGMHGALRSDQDYWYAFSTRLSDDWQPDTQSELFAQWLPAQDDQSPPVSGPVVGIYVYGDQYRIKTRWGAGARDYKNLWRGPVCPDAGKWVDWVFHVTWSAGPDGRVEAWKNGEAIIDYRGRNFNGSGLAPYLKLGIYKWPWKRPADETPSAVTRREMYVDEIRIGGRESSYSKVCPHGTLPEGQQ